MRKVEGPATQEVDTRVSSLCRSLAGGRECRANSSDGQANSNYRSGHEHANKTFHPGQEQDYRANDQIR